MEKFSGHLSISNTYPIIKTLARTANSNESVNTR